LNTGQLLQLFYELGSLLIAFCIGIYAFKRMNTFFRLAFFQLSFWLLCYSLSYIVTLYQRQNGLPMNNQWLMNLHLIGETMLLITAAFVQITEKPMKIFVGCAFLAFLVILIIQLITNGIVHYLNAMDVSECVIMTMLFGYILYKAIIDRKKDNRNRAVVLLSIGLLIYFACSVPFMALIQLIQQRDPNASALLFHVISDVIANLRYLFLAAAFWVISRPTIHLNQEP
jgi:hypothetical protein